MRRRTRLAARRAALRLAAGGTVMAVLLGGCSAARANLGTTNSPCYVALPAAHGAVHGGGRLVGVRLETVSSLRQPALPLYQVAASGHPSKGARVCLVAYVGRFSASSVDRPRGRGSGRLAVVVLGYPGNMLLGTILVRQAPLRFGHSHLGP